MDHPYPDLLLEGRLLRRYKRFLADVELANGEKVVAHCGNTGAMTGCATPGSRIWLSPARNPGRKLRYTWEIVEAEGTLIGVHPALANDVVAGAIQRNAIPELTGYAEVQREVRFGERSRVDFLLTDPVRGRCFLEVKSVTLAIQGVARFPDAQTARGRRHLEELSRVVAEGERAVAFFLVVRGDCARFAPADSVDPEYGEALRQAVAGGVEAMAWSAEITPTGLRVDAPLPIDLEG